jgi:hypothetical protein
MSDTDDIIDLQIEVSDKVPEKPNFGVPILVDYHTAWIDRFTAEYSQAADMLDDGFSVNDALYKMAVKVKSQNPAPSTFKVGRLQTPYTQTVDLIPAVTTEGFIYRGVVNGVPIEYEVPAASTTQSIVEGIEPLVEAVTDVSSSEDDTKITATSPAGRLLEHNWSRGMRVIDVTPNAGFDADMALIFDEDSAWYGMTLGPQSEPYILAAAAWTEANKRIYIPQSADWDVVDSAQTTDVASQLRTLAYARTAGIWHRAIAGGEWAGAAFLSSFLGRDPGAATPAFKTLAGISADTLRAGEKSALAAKFFTRYIRQGGQNITFEGKTPSGRYIDVTRNVDWLDAEVRANIFGVFVNNPVVPYSDVGISLIRGAVEQALKTGQEIGVIATDPAPVVSVPKVLQTNPADRAARILRNVLFTARLNGAIHRVIVRGSVSV